MSRKTFVVIVVIALLSVTVLGLSYNLYEADKLGNIFLGELVRADQELYRVRVIDFVDQHGVAYKIRISRDEAKIEPVAESQSTPTSLPGVSVPNYDAQSAPTSQSE